LFAELREQLDEVERLAGKSRSDPVALINRCRVLTTKAHRIFDELKPDEESGDGMDLEGLLRLRPRGGSLAPEVRSQDLFGLG